MGLRSTDMRQLWPRGAVPPEPHTCMRPTELRRHGIEVHLRFERLQKLGTIGGAVEGGHRDSDVAHTITGDGWRNDVAQRQ